MPMSIKEINKRLVRARRPIDFFGNVSPKELMNEFRKYAKIIHPDAAQFSNDPDKYLAPEAFKMLNNLYERGLQELEKGIYTIVDTATLYNHSTELFRVTCEKEVYRFYEHYCVGEVANIYKGKDGKNIVYLKIAIDQADNKLISDEFRVLNSIHHQSLPIVEQPIKINGCMAFIMREAPGLSVPDLLERYGDIPAEHVMWMLERLFSVVGYLHYNCIVHGNIKPEHVIVNPDNHNVSLVGFSMCIPQANLDTAKYKIINDGYTAPEVNSRQRVRPNTDIYSIGKVAILLLGGDVNNNTMPLNIDNRVQDFIHCLVNPNPSLRPDDAWILWNETIELRNQVFGKERFKKLEKKL